MGFEIRKASIADALIIADIIQRAFDDEADIDRVERQIHLSNTMIDVALIDGQVAGFVENFVTRSQDNTLRLELDLLAVHPDMQGNGVGRQLIGHSIKLASSLCVSAIRALIATKNAPMHHLCGGLGMVEDERDSGLYVKNPSYSQLEIAGTGDGSHLIQVNTSTYDGIWLEGELSQSAIDIALMLVNTQGLDIVGVVCPKSDANGIQLLQQNKFAHINDYRRWTLNLRND